MADEILVTERGSVLDVLLNRPDAGNAVSDAMAARLTGILLGRSPATNMVVLRGAGTDFCVGRETAGRPRGDKPEALERRRRTEVIFDCYSAFRRAEIPIIGVVQGRAYGFGCTLAALCDITIAAENASFQIPEMSHNTLPTMVMSAMVDRIPRKALAYLVYSTAPVTAQRALIYGLVSEVIPATDVETTVESLLKAMNKAPQPALFGVKEYMRSAYELSTQGALDLARNLHATINSSSEMRPSAHP